ncbi:DeoR/GlpR family DNA-binding transcription regulator [Paenibacillus sp. YPG26]|uniref:DeoR/GlpR family DNA-binding transcription regulator n=1 Tax=Paenibacillus sp. YPG26 TaxID=2878915 RepID=UPI00203D678B|nr:DeoR/GlpR family DNA-binding transcription regulator [Paenibacillus sp. YPG26]USB31612.1 DeoR/GlpR family DNA-binding transcription regulator [Paenibacillus sp. YPG26]
MSVLAEGRKLQIKHELEREGKVMVVPLSRQFGVSAETIRRDLQVLEKEGHLRRVYGGAVKSSFRGNEAPYNLRQKMYAAEKRAIGERAAMMIKDGGTVVIDGGTTTLEMAKAIRGRRGLTILTSSLPLAACLLEGLSRDQFSGKVIMLGGEVSPLQHSITGIAGERMMRGFSIDQAFISVGGVSLTHGFTDFDLNEASMSCAFAEAAQEVIVLADHSKFGINTFAPIMPTEQCDYIVCDQVPTLQWQEHLRKRKVAWVIAPMEST